MLSFSVVIPCYHDEDKLAALLGQLQESSNAYRLPSSELLEIIVVDGANSSKCREVCKIHDTRWVAGEPCRGQQLRTGAALAKNDVLWFLHADHRLSADSVIAMRIAFEQGAVGGYFRFRFDAPRAWPALLLEPAISFRCRFGTPYGDQGLFMKRQAYVESGGHSPWPLFEEVSLVSRLRRLGRFISLPEPIFVDPRRWTRDGWWRRTWVNRRLALAFVRGVPPEKLAARYRSRTT